MQTPLMLRQLGRLRAQLDATGIVVGFRAVGGSLSAVWPDGATPTDEEREKVGRVLADFRPDDTAAQRDYDAGAEIDAVSDAILDLILAAKALPPTATRDDVREQAKAGRRARRGARDRGGRP